MQCVMSNALSYLLNKSYFPGLSFETSFKALTEEFCGQANREGLNISPHRQETWEKFGQLTLSKQREKHDQFLRYYQICSSGLESGLSLLSGNPLLKRMLLQSGLTSCDGLWHQLREEDVIEVYTADFTQLYRNMKFLEVCSYPIADLYVNEWVDLYRRPQTITTTLVQSIQDMLRSQPAASVLCSVPDHFLEEKFSPERRKFYVRQKIFSPLLDSRGVAVAFVGSLHATLLNENASDDRFPQNVTPLSR
jgi:hypothetical protein